MGSGFPGGAADLRALEQLCHFRPLDRLGCQLWRGSVEPSGGPAGALRAGEWGAKGGLPPPPGPPPIFFPKILHKLNIVFTKKSMGRHKVGLCFVIEGDT